MSENKRKPLFELMLETITSFLPDSSPESEKILGILVKLITESDPASWGHGLVKAEIAKAWKALEATDESILTTNKKLQILDKFELFLEKLEEEYS